MEIDYFLGQHLNEKQKEAVSIINKNVLVLAGAGSGKTRVITAKIVHLVRVHKVVPQNILAITFTNKAANEMKDRINAMLQGIERSQLYIKTFHAFGVQLLRFFISHFKPYTANFSIIDVGEQRSLVKKILDGGGELGLKDAYKEFLWFVSQLKQQKTYPGDSALSARAKQLIFKDNAKHAVFVKAYAQYQAMLEKNNRFDFDDLIALPVRLFNKDAAVRSYVSSCWQHVLVDEYQDVDMLQEEIVQVFAKGGSMLTVVGDDSQSIYGFRGAQVENILKFHKRTANSCVVMLEENYRSTQSILKLSNEVIMNNPVVYEKKLYSQKKDGPLPLLRIFKSDLVEAKWVVENISLLLKEGTIPGEIAIFYRANAQSRLFEEMLVAAQVPYKIIKGRRFYERKEIRATLSYLQFVLNPQDVMALTQVINFPTRNIGNKSLIIILAEIERLAPAMSVLEALQQKDLLAKLSKKASASLTEFVKIILFVQDLINNKEPANFIVDKLVQRSRLWEHFAKINDEYERTDRLEALKQLAVAAARHVPEDADVHPLVDFLRFVMLSGSEETEELEKSVHLITLHNAKGLEYENVHIVGLEEEVFPHILAINENSVEEERRLLYVGITRAKERLFLSAATLKNRYGSVSAHMVSRFVYEFPQKLLDKRSDFDWLGARDGLEIDDFF